MFLRLLEELKGYYTKFHLLSSTNKEDIFNFINSCFSKEQLNLLDRSNFKKTLKKQLPSKFFLRNHYEPEKRVKEVIDKYSFLFDTKLETKEIRNFLIKKTIDAISVTDVLNTALDKYIEVFVGDFWHYKHGPSNRIGSEGTFLRHLYFFPVDLITKEIENKYPVFTKINPIFSGLIRRDNWIKRTKKNEEECREFGVRLLKEFNWYIYSTTQTEYCFKSYEILLKEVRRFFKT